VKGPDVVISKKIIGFVFFISLVSNNTHGMEQQQYSSLPAPKQKIVKKNLHRPPPLSPPNKDTNHTENAKEFFSSAPRSRQNSARPKQESQDEDSSPITLNKLFTKICAIEKDVQDIKKNQQEILVQQAHTQSCVSALIKSQEATAMKKTRKKLPRNNRTHASQPSVGKEAIQTLSICLESSGESISDASPLE
jgi:ElaB/YqjD/DUF883 family membrane-anchored ribosome-binding protein